MKDLSKQLSGITLVQLIIIITRTQARGKICFVTINIHNLHAGLLSKELPPQKPRGKLRHGGGDGGVWPSQSGKLASLQGSGFSPLPSWGRGKAKASGHEDTEVPWLRVALKLPQLDWGLEAGVLRTMFLPRSQKRNPK